MNLHFSSELSFTSHIHLYNTQVSAFKHLHLSIYKPFQLLYKHDTHSQYRHMLQYQVFVSKVRIHVNPCHVCAHTGHMILPSH